MWFSTQILIELTYPFILKVFFINDLDKLIETCLLHFSKIYVLLTDFSLPFLPVV